MEYYQIKNTSKKEAEIRIYGEIWSYGEGSSRNLSNQLRELAKTNDSVTIKVNSPGGSVVEAVAIYNIIKNSDIHVTMIVEGIAASAMSFILMAADKVVMGKSTRLMLHKLRSSAYAASANKMRNTADMMDSWETDIYELYADKTGMTVDKIKEEFFKEGQDIWLSPKQAMSYGLIDEIIEGNVKSTPKDNKVNNLKNYFEHYQVQIDNHYKPNKNQMNKEHLAKLGLPENATEDQINAKLDELTAKKPSSNATPSNSVDNELQARVEEMEKERVENLVNSAIVDGKITASEKADWLELATNNYKTASNAIANMKGREALPVNPAGGSTPENRDNWTMDDYLKKDGQALVALEKENPKKYQELLDKAYGN